MRASRQWRNGECCGKPTVPLGEIYPTGFQILPHVSAGWSSVIIRFERRLVPRSERRHSGTPNRGKTSSASSLAMRVVFWSGTANTRGDLVNRSWITMTCRFPSSVSGRSMISIPRIWKGFDKGIGWSGGLLALPAPVTMAHSGQALANIRASLNIPSHHQWTIRAL